MPWRTVAWTRQNRHGEHWTALLGRPIDEHWIFHAGEFLYSTIHVDFPSMPHPLAEIDPPRGILLSRQAMGNYRSLILVSWSKLMRILIGVQKKDMLLVSENLLILGFDQHTTQLDDLIPRLRRAVKNATDGTGKASDLKQQL